MEWYRELAGLYGERFIDSVLDDLVGMGLEIELMSGLLNRIERGEIGDFHDIVMCVSYELDDYAYVSRNFGIGEFSRVRNGLGLILSEVIAFYDDVEELDFDLLVRSIGSWRDVLVVIRSGYMEQYGITEGEVLEYRRDGLNYMGYGSY